MKDIAKRYLQNQNTKTLTIKSKSNQDKFENKRIREKIRECFTTFILNNEKAHAILSKSAYFSIYK